MKNHSDAKVPPDLNDILERIESIRGRIRAAAERARRDPSGIRLIAVSKGQPLAAIERARTAGLLEFGENYLEEALPKIHTLDPSVTWHMIGHVQGRKAKGVVENFRMVHSVDSLALARRLSHFATESGKTIPVLLECNLSGETSKFGWPASDPSAWASLWAPWREILTLPGLSLLGLMTMAAYSSDPETSRPVFSGLRRLRDSARENLPGSGWVELSMGMSDDFEPAVEEGATMVRIGRALFGSSS
jgi:pyridoxal phosphate enzyme (YggS family)